MLLYFSVTNVSTANPLKGVSKYFFTKIYHFYKQVQKTNRTTCPYFHIRL